MSHRPAQAPGLGAVPDERRGQDGRHTHGGGQATPQPFGQSPTQRCLEAGVLTQDTFYFQSATYLT